MSFYCITTELNNWQDCLFFRRSLSVKLTVLPTVLLFFFVKKNFESSILSGEVLFLAFLKLNKNHYHLEFLNDKLCQIYCHKGKRLAVSLAIVLANFIGKKQMLRDDILEISQSLEESLHLETCCHGIWLYKIML